MCYAAPGPRCAAYAIMKLAEAKEFKRKVRALGESFDDFVDAERKIVEAQQIFDATPAGLKILADKMSLSYVEEETKLRFEVAQSLRAAQLKTIKELNLKKVEHNKVKPIAKPVFGNTFLSDDVVRKDDDFGVVESKIAQLSEQWLNNLSNNEVAQVEWMTDYGCMESNTHIGGVNNYRGNNGVFPAENIEKRMKVVDKALSKYRTKNEVVVYRGVRKGLLPEHMRNDYRTSNDVKQETFLQNFVVGETFTSPYYMPTSFQPQIGSSFADFGVVMEIRTRKAAPLSLFSISAREQEALIPRDSVFKIIGIKKNIDYGHKKVTVIQLEQQ